MRINNLELCDYCFSEKTGNGACPKCGLMQGAYHTQADLLTPGTNLFGKYIIGKTLGRGGFGVTYLAYSTDKHSPVAVKEYYPNQIACRAAGDTVVSLVSNEKSDLFQRGAKRFFEEAKTMSKFNGSSNIVTVYEFFYCNNTAYYSMEYLEGMDLKHYIGTKNGRIPEDEAVKIMKAISEALMVIHSTGTLHRDISPDNIFMCDNGDVKLIDFGAAKQVIGERSQSLSVILKQGFAPFEQYQKNGNQGMWTDIYALGATMYYAVTGRVPEDAMSRAQDPRLPIDPSYGISPQFVAVLDKCMRPRIHERYQSAGELLHSLNRLNEPVMSGMGTGENIGPISDEGGKKVNQINGGGWQPPPDPSWGYSNDGRPTTMQEEEYKKERREALIKKIIVIVGVVFIVAMLVTVFIELLKPTGSASLQSYRVAEISDACTSLLCGGEI